MGGGMGWDGGGKVEGLEGGLEVGNVEGGW